jgi:opacity protein-like surface antigen
MKNTTLAMVAVLAAVVMLSAVLAAVPMQQASASNGGGDSEVKTGDNKVKIKQSNECEEVIIACGNFLRGEITQNTGEDDFPPGPP